MLYTGIWGIQVAKDEYDRIIGEWIANGRRLHQQTNTSELDAPASVNQILAAFVLFAKDYYRNPDASTAGEYSNYLEAMHYVRKLYGRTPGGKFGPMALKVVRDAMIRGEANCDGPSRRSGWCRSNVNRQIGRIKAIFKWAVAQEIIPPSVYQALQSVTGLRAGKTEARESAPVKPVDERTINAVIPYLAREVAAMVRLQRLTGARPGELCAMRSCDIDRSGKVWVYRPVHHKTEHHGHDRVIMIGLKAQEILTPFLKANLQAFCFSPADAEQARHEQQRKERKTPVQPSQVKRAVCSQRRNRQRPPADHYTVASYRRAIARACDKANRERCEQARKQGVTITGRLVQRFHPHQLRHSAATAIKNEFGWEAAQVVLGHKSMAVTQLYVEEDFAKAREIMERVG
jgi:integrase